MNDRLLELCATGQAADAAVHRAFAEGFLALAAFDQLGALDMRAAHRAALGNPHRPRIGWTAFADHLHDLRNHIASAADDHRIADHHPQPRHLVHIVQRRIGHGNASHFYRFQARHRRHRAGAANLELHIE
ncbi:hypothetical protein D9M68_540460 [compost metagenome]